MNNIFYDIEDGCYRTYPDGDIASGNEIRNIIKNNETIIMKYKKENQELKSKIKTYEDSDDLTLMFMYCDEKAKDKIKELKKQLEEYKRLGFKHLNDKCNELENQQKEFIKYLTSYIKLLNNKPDLIEESQIDILKEILQKYKEIIGVKDEKI